MGGKKLTRRTPVANGWHYRGDRSTCGCCPRRAECVPASASVRIIFIANGHEALLRARRRRARWDSDTINWYKRHCWRVEGIHGEAKQQHGLARAARRGMDNVSIQAWLTAAAINLKRLAAALLRLSAPQTALKTYLLVISASFFQIRLFSKLVFASRYQFQAERISLKFAA